MAGTKSGKGWHPTPTRSAWVAVGELSVDVYERPITRRKVSKIKQEFDPDAIGSIYVSERKDGRMVIMDGQHRVLAVNELWGPKEKVPCLIYVGLSQADEARLFGLFNEERTKPRPLDLFYARIVAQDEVAVDIAKIVADIGLEIGGGQGARIGCVQHMDNVYRQGGPLILRRTLGILTTAWGHEQQAVQGVLVQGIGLVVSRYRSRLDDRRMGVKTLSTFTPEQMIAKARFAKSAQVGMGSPGALYRIDSTIAAHAVALYNRGLRHEQKVLPGWEDRNATVFWEEILEDRAHD